MTAICMRVPKFCYTQWVSFIGGEGIVRSYKTEAGSWIYLIEMAMGLEPNFGRVGPETMVVLAEADLRPAGSGEVLLTSLNFVSNAKTEAVNPSASVQQITKIPHDNFSICSLIPNNNHLLPTING